MQRLSLFKDPYMRKSYWVERPVLLKIAGFISAQFFFRHREKDFLFFLSGGNNIPY